MKAEAGFEGGDVDFDVFDLLGDPSPGVKVGEALAGAGELGFENTAFVGSSGHHSTVERRADKVCSASMSKRTLIQSVSTLSQVSNRIRHARGRNAGETTLEQTFQFEADVNAAMVADLLRSAPLVGEGSIFGDRPGHEETDDAGSRHLRGFSPAPGFRFDVDLAERDEGVFVASFSQPHSRRPYLEGDVVWLLRDESGGTLFHEEINTDLALATGGGQPLSGEGPSLRRWLFFRVGHAQVMRGAIDNIARLAQAR